MKFFEDLRKALKALEERGNDKILMDLSVSTKKEVYDRLLAQAQRIHSITGNK